LALEPCTVNDQYYCIGGRKIFNLAFQYIPSHLLIERSGRKAVNPWKINKLNVSLAVTLDLAHVLFYGNTRVVGYLLPKPG
tara:strand:+ start:2951 stop:3193 length:243 start_codon:yes stop_codon:yes gene_type:complete